MILDLVHLLRQVVHCAFLQGDPALHFFDLVVHALDHYVLRFAAILCLHSRLHAKLLVAPILELQLEQLLALGRVELLPLAEVSNLDQQLLLVHLSFHVIEHGYGNVIDDLQLFVNLRQHEYFLCD